MTEVRGFVVAAWESGSRLFFSGRLEDGRSFACIAGRGDASLLVREEEVASASRALGLGCADGGDSGSGRPDASREPERSGGDCAAELDEKPWSDMAGKALARFFLPSERLFRAERLLRSAGVVPLSVERGSAEDYLSRRGIRGGVAIRGEGREGRRVDLVFVEAELAPADVIVPLRWLALDLETDRDESILAASLVSRAPLPGAEGRAGTDFSEALFLGPPTGDPRVSSFPDEASLLRVLAERFQAIDPDVLTGWNILDFDWRVLAKRFEFREVAFAFGRSDEAARLLDRGGKRLVALCPGRAVIDSLRLIRASGERFDDMRLETVAQSLLGEGKSVSAEGEDKLDELDRLRASDPAAFCSYCIRDSDLVIRLLDKTGLHRLTQARAALTGLSLDLAWTSIPAFERVYAAGLRERRVAVPLREELRVSGAAGGTVLEPLAGIFDAVFVFDFRSLYPSLMRSFNIDPLAYARAQGRLPLPGDIIAPNGARFDREAGILPSTIARYAAERERALANGDETAAYVYKILQNSFYGVLGAEGCRYARTELAGAVTSFGRKFLLLARDFFEGRGFRTLYGDTDSVFVESGLGAEARFDRLEALGSQLAAALNEELAVLIGREYGLESHLRIRCEKIYRRFFIPRLRAVNGSSRGRAMLPGIGSEEGAPRGRAKGYAGLRMEADGSHRVEVKGMEAARSDWTPLARRFQMEFLDLAFGLPPPSVLAAYCRAKAADLREGRLDAELVYRKVLRRAPEDYASSSPQVKAALLLGRSGRRGSVTFVLTKSGPEPASRRSSAELDYEHYAVHQLLPIARAIVEAVALARSAAPPPDEALAAAAGDWDVDAWFADRPQMELVF